MTAGSVIVLAFWVIFTVRKHFTPETDGLNSPWNLAGGGCCILQSSIRKGDREMGSQSL